MQFTKAGWTAVAFFSVLLVLVLSQMLGDHSVAPRTEVEKRAAIEKSVKDPAHAVYDPEVVVFANQGYEDEVINGRFLHPDSLGLLYLTYLMEGSITGEAKVDFCLGALPKVMESYRLLDQLIEKRLNPTPEQSKLLERINSAYKKANVRYQNDPACPQPTTSDQQKVRT